MKSMKRTLLASAVVLTGMNTLPPAIAPAGANQVQLHELLFNRRKREEFQQRRQQTQPQRVQPQPRQTTQRPRQASPAPKPRAVAKIESPQFFTYARPDLVAVSIASLLPDMESTGATTAPGVSADGIALPPMTMLDPVAPQAGQQPAAQDAPALPPMTVLDPVAPSIPGAAAVAPAPANDSDAGSVIIPQLTILEPSAPPVPAIEDSAPQLALPPLPQVPAGPVRLASSEYFAMAASQAPEGQLRLAEDIADAVRAHYTDNPDFLWSDGVTVSPKAEALLAVLGAADDHGLNAADYAVGLPGMEPAAGETPVERARALIAFDVRLTARALRLAQDLRDGVIEPDKLSGYHDFSNTPRLTAEDAMRDLASAANPADWLEGMAPRHVDYGRLKAELARLQTVEDDLIVFPDGIVMKAGETEESLPLLMRAIDRKLRDETRAAHAATLAAYDGSMVYDADIVALVKDVQRDLGLVADGIVGPKTLARLGGETTASKITRVKLAMERLRWHPENYGRRHVVINQPEYRVRYLENDRVALAMNAIVGKTSNQTNFFHDEIETVVFNPYWGVPQSIIVNDMLPRLWRDPGYLDRSGYVVSTAGGKVVSSSAVNWRQYNGPVPYNVRQKPGPKNALGELKILFPNKHAIYMHDTPARSLFARSDRAFSHGCVRLEDPRAMAAAVLGKPQSYVVSQLGGYEQAERVAEKIPVYVGYFTAWPDDAGTVQYHADIYDRDEHLLKAFAAVAQARGS